MLALILISSFVMTLEDVWYTTKPMLMDVLYYLDKILTVVFFLETCLKLVAINMSAYSHKQPTRTTEASIHAANSTSHLV